MSAIFQNGEDVEIKLK